MMLEYITQAALELSLQGLIAAAAAGNGDGNEKSDGFLGGDGTPSTDGGTPGGGCGAWREGCVETEEVDKMAEVDEMAEMEDQLATLRLQLHIADDELQQRRQSLGMLDQDQDEHGAACSAAPYVEYGAAS